MKSIVKRTKQKVTLKNVSRQKLKVIGEYIDKILYENKDITLDIAYKFQRILMSIKQSCSNKEDLLVCDKRKQQLTCIIDFINESKSMDKDCNNIDEKVINLQSQKTYGRQIETNLDSSEQILDKLLDLDTNYSENRNDIQANMCSDNTKDQNQLVQPKIDESIKDVGTQNLVKLNNEIFHNMKYNFTNDPQNEDLSKNNSGTNFVENTDNLKTEILENQNASKQISTEILDPDIQMLNKFKNISLRDQIPKPVTRRSTRSKSNLREPQKVSNKQLSNSKNIAEQKLKKYTQLQITEVSHSKQSIPNVSNNESKNTIKLEQITEENVTQNISNNCDISTNLQQPCSSTQTQEKSQTRKIPQLSSRRAPNKKLKTELYIEQVNEGMELIEEEIESTSEEETDDLFLCEIPSVHEELDKSTLSKVINSFKEKLMKDVNEIQKSIDFPIETNVTEVPKNEEILLGCFGYEDYEPKSLFERIPTETSEVKTTWVDPFAELAPFPVTKKEEIEPEEQIIDWNEICDMLNESYIL